MRQAFVLPESVKSFHDYFNLSASAETIAEALGYTFHRSSLVLPESAVVPEWVVSLRNRLQRLLPNITLDSEAARREMLIAPILIELATSLDLKLRIEFVEAKQGDTSRGMSQLVAELAALDQWTLSEEPVLYGALSTGEIWCFAHLERRTKTITQDVNLFRVPADLAELARVLVGILT